MRRDPRARTYSVHRLIQALLRDELAADARWDLAERAVKALNRAFPDVDYADWPQGERLLPHARTAKGWIESENLRIPEAARLLNRVGFYLYSRGRYDESESLIRRALAIREQALGPDHPDTATSLNNLAVLLRFRGRYEESESLIRRALAIREQALGPDHPDTAISLNNLAITLQVQSRYAEAELLLRQALAIREQALGPDHPDTAISLNDLAALLLAQGRPEEAEPLLRRALAIRETILGPDHTDTAISLNNLAELLRIQGRLEEAERLNRRALAIRETILGPDHTDTAISLNNLALSLKRKLESLSSEKISDEEDNEPKRLLVYLHKTLRCDFDLEPSGLEERLVAFLMEYRPYTLTGLDKAYSLICDQNLKTAASRIDEIIRLVLPFQLPQELWARVLEQHKQGRTVLANAAPGVVFAEAVAARIDGKPIGVSLDGEGIKAPNRFGPFPVELPPLDAPEETLRSLVRVLLISAHLETGPTGEAGTMTVPDMMSVLCGFFEWWRNRHERAPYVVVRMPKDPNDRTNYERALAQIKEGAEHVMFLEYYTDPAALMVEGGLLGFLHTHLVSERKWKTP